MFRNSQLDSIRALRRMSVVGEAIDFRDNSILPDSAIRTFRDSMVARGLSTALSA
jgi:hypothetical protein